MKTTADLQQFFDLVVVLNLPSRGDRWRAFQRRLPSDWPFAPPLRFPAIDGRSLTRPDWWEGGAGAWGCYLSHMAIFRDCMRNGIESVLILEDDVAFAPDFGEQVRSFIAHLPDDWEYIYVGGEHIQLELGGPTRVNDRVYRPYNVNRTHAYAIRGQAMLKRLYEFLSLEAEWPSPHHIDHRMGALHKQLESGLYVPRQWLAIQSQGRSDIAGKTVNTMLFRGAQWLCEAKPTQRMVAVLSADESSGNVVAGFLHHLGVRMTREPEVASVDDTSQTFEDASLAFVAQACFDAQSQGARLPREDRERLLRLWAAEQSELCKPDRDLIAGMHPVLCLMGEELQCAWNKPFFVVVDDENIQSSDTKSEGRLDTTAARRLTAERETFLARNSVPHLRIDCNSLAQNPLPYIEQLTTQLGFSPTAEETQAACDFVMSHSLTEKDRGKQIGIAP